MQESPFYFNETFEKYLIPSGSGLLPPTETVRKGRPMELHFLEAIVSAFHPPPPISLIMSAQAKAGQVGKEENMLAVKSKPFSLFFFLRMRLAAKMQVRSPAPPFSMCATLRIAFRLFLSLLFLLYEMEIIITPRPCC